MRVLLVGGTGAVGRPLTRLLCAAGHEVSVMSRSAANAGPCAAVGAELVVGDALQAVDVRLAFEAVGPQAVVHLATALPDPIRPRKVAQDLVATNRLRREATAHLVEQVREHAVERFLAQSICFAYAPTGDAVKTEDAPLNLCASGGFHEAVQAVAELERLTTSSNGIVLRYGNFYGPGTTYGAGGGSAEMIRKRRFPVVGDGGAVFSFVHVDDAATATVEALEQDGPAIFNICDDEPATVREWLPVMARALGAPRPRRVPVWMARLAAGPWGVEYMTQLRGACNARAKKELGWQPSYSSWRQGFMQNSEGQA